MDFFIIFTGKRKPLSMRYLYIIILILSLTTTNATISNAGDLTWPQVFQMINENFPNLPEKSVSELAQLQKENTSIYLFDVRKRKEFEVSHINGAYNLTSVTQIEDKVPRKDALIIVYCSVGYRSAAVVEKLRLHGYQNSYNLKGSIFQWANSGYKIYKGNEETTQVHPYNSKWGVLLKKKYHYKGGWLWW